MSVNAILNFVNNATHFEIEYQKKGADKPKTYRLSHVEKFVDGGFLAVTMEGEWKTFYYMRIHSIGGQRVKI